MSRGGWIAAGCLCLVVTLSACGGSGSFTRSSQSRSPSRSTATTSGGASPAASQLTGLPAVADTTDSGNQIKGLLNSAGIYEAVIAPGGCQNVDVGIEAYGAAFPSKDADIVATNNNPQGCNTAFPPSVFYSIRSGAVRAKANGCNCQAQNQEWQRLTGLYSSATQPADFRIQSGNVVPVGGGSSSGSSSPATAAPTTAPRTAPPETAPPTTAALPVVDADPADPSSFSPQVEPADIYLSGDSGNIITGLTWAAWDAKGATGNGTVTIQGCVPDCASGTQTPTPVKVYLNDPVNGAFSLLTEEVQGQTPVNISIPTGPGQYEGTPTVSVPGQP